MAGREMSYIEFKERLRLCGHEGNAVVGLWNSLAEYWLGAFGQRYGEPADCTLSVSRLRGLSPERAERLRGFGSARSAVLLALQKSLRANSAELRDYRCDISRDGLMLFALPGVARVRVGVAWNSLCRAVGDDAVTVDGIEVFCARVRGGYNPPKFGKSELALLEAWLKHLKKGR